MTNRNSPNTTPLEEIPKKIYYSISEASDFTGVEPHVLRYWETKFTKLNPKRVGGNQRKYTRSDIELLYEIVNLLYCEGYTLDGAERKLRAGLQALRAERENEKEKQANHQSEKNNTHPEHVNPNSQTIEEPTQISGPTLSSIKEELSELLKLLDE